MTRSKFGATAPNQRRSSNPKGEDKQKNKEHTRWRYALLMATKDNNEECLDVNRDPESKFIFEHLRQQIRGEVKVTGTPWKAARHAWRPDQAWRD